jgi:hypothetical protein
MSEQKPDNSARPLLTGWRLWLRLSAPDVPLDVYSDPAFPECPECGSPNVRLTTGRKGLRLTAGRGGNRYGCMEKNCGSKGPAEVTSSTGIERRRALIRARIIVLVPLAVLLILALTGHLPAN